MAVLQPGAIDANGNWLDFDCMAKRMEDALPPPVDAEDSGRVGRREFLIAISRGVIDYLRAHENDGFAVHTTFDAVDRAGTLEIL